VSGALRLRGLEDGERDGGTTEVEQATSAGGDVLVVASAGAEEVTELVVASRPVSRVAMREGVGEPSRPVSDVLALPHTDWLYHHLRVSGDPGEVAAFRAAAAGAGAIPWQPDLGPAAEDWFHLLVAPPAPQQRSLSLAGARLLVQIERAAASRTCPLDLHRLLPVPARLLRRGPDHAEARAWLWTHWGTTQALRGVVELPVPARGQPRRPDPGLWWVGFWAADWTPWRAILALRGRWPALRIEVRPRYDEP
jgi:hypothetical protein